MTAGLGSAPVRPRDPTAAATASFAIHGVAFVVESEIPSALEAVIVAYGAFRVPSDVVTEQALRLSLHKAEGRYLLIDHRGSVAVVAQESWAVLGLLDRVVQLVLDQLARRDVIGTHAGVVAIDGWAVLLAGRSGRGKSTLTLGLLRRGAAFLTDELALITPEETVLPYPRALHVRPATLALLPELGFLEDRPRHDLGDGSEWSVTLDDLDRAFGARLAPATPLAAIVLIAADPDPGRRQPTIEPVPAAVASLELIRGTPAAALDFAGTIGRLGTITASVPTARLWTGELDRTATVILDWLASQP